MPKFGTKNAWFWYFWPRVWKEYCHIWNQHPRICLIAKFCQKAKMPKFGIKNCLNAIILKNYCHIWNQNLPICLLAKFCEETKMFKFGTKNVLFGYFWTKMAYLDIFWAKIKKNNYCCIWNWHTWICLIAKYCEIMKMPKFGTKSALFGYFWDRFLKNYCRIWNQNLRICLLAKFCEETKMFKFGTKNVLFEYFWPKMLYLDVFGSECFKKTVVIFEISTLRFV